MTNVGTVSCSVAGAPTVTLLAGGVVIGQPLQPAPGGATVVLAPNAAATARAVVSSTCNAPVSDTARVMLSGLTQAMEVPAVLRACSGVVNPFLAS